MQEEYLSSEVDCFYDKAFLIWESNKWSPV